MQWKEWPVRVGCCNLSLHCFAVELAGTSTDHLVRWQVSTRLLAPWGVFGAANGEGRRDIDHKARKDFSESFDGWPCPRGQVQLGGFCELLRSRSKRMPVCGRVFFGASSFFFSFFFSVMLHWEREVWTRSREREATRREQKMTAAPCISAGGCPAPAACSVPAHGRF